MSQNRSTHVFSCRENESIVIGEIEVTVVELDGDNVVFRIDGLGDSEWEEFADDSLLVGA